MPDIVVLPHTVAVCRLDAHAPVPVWASADALLSITRTAEELSIVCHDDFVPPEIVAEKGWRCLRVAGELDFALVGVLASILRPLAEAAIPVFVVSTFVTDYLLVKERDLERATESLEQGGHSVIKEPVMILVVGATGTNGREVVDRLVAMGKNVRALVRDPARASNLRKPGVELVKGDLSDPASLDTALAGVDHVFFVAAVDERYTAWFHNFLEAARRAGTAHVVKFSGMGADPESPSDLMRQHGQTDRVLADSGLGYTILRPNSFYQNMLWSADSIKEHGTFYMPMQDARQSLVDVRDIADVAVSVLTESGHDGKTYELTGPESLSYHDVAATLSRVLGKRVTYVDVSPEAAKQAMLQTGMPQWNAEALMRLFETFVTGIAARTTDAVEKLTGKKPLSFEQFARDHATAFTKAAC